LVSVLAQIQNYVPALRERRWNCARLQRPIL
jgi:hypothetical protein